jgi:hypothetical protein
MHAKKTPLCRVLEGKYTMQYILIKRFLWLLINYAIWANYRRKGSNMHTELDLIVTSFLQKIHLEANK